MLRQSRLVQCVASSWPRFAAHRGVSNRLLRRTQVLVRCVFTLSKSILFFKCRTARRLSSGVAMYLGLRKPEEPMCFSWTLFISCSKSVCSRWSMPLCLLYLQVTSHNSVSGTEEQCPCVPRGTHEGAGWTEAVQSMLKLRQPKRACHAASTSLCAGYDNTTICSNTAHNAIGKLHGALPPPGLGKDASVNTNHQSK